MAFKKKNNFVSYLLSIDAEAHLEYRVFFFHVCHVAFMQKGGRWWNIMNFPSPVSREAINHVWHFLLLNLNHTHTHTHTHTYTHPTLPNTHLFEVQIGEWVHGVHVLMHSECTFLKIYVCFSCLGSCGQFPIMRKSSLNAKCIQQCSFFVETCINYIYIYILQLFCFSLSLSLPFSGPSAAACSLLNQLFSLSPR